MDCCDATAAAVSLSFFSETLRAGFGTSFGFFLTSVFTIGGKVVDGMSVFSEGYTDDSEF